MEFPVISYDPKDVQKAKLYIAKPDASKTTIGSLKDAYNIRLDLKTLSMDILEFEVPYFINNKENPNISKLKNKYLVKFVYGDYIQYFQIDTPKDNITDNADFKTFYCLSLENELAVKNLRSFTVTSYNLQQLMNEILTGTNWTVNHIDTILQNKFRSFDINSISKLDFINNNVSESYDAIPIFDTVNRQINFYHIDNVGQNKGLRVSRKRYLKTLDLEEDSTNFATHLYPYGRNNLTIRGVNPTGTAYIEDLSYFLNIDFMDQDLIDAIIAYNALINSKDGIEKTAEENTDGTTIYITDHNAIVDDFIYNRTRKKVRRVISVIDTDSFTVDNVENQEEDDIIVIYKEDTFGKLLYTQKEKESELTGLNNERFDIYNNWLMSDDIRIIQENAEDRSFYNFVYDNSPEIREVELDSDGFYTVIGIVSSTDNLLIRINNETITGITPNEWSIFKKVSEANQLRIELTGNAVNTKVSFLVVKLTVNEFLGNYPELVTDLTGENNDLRYIAERDSELYVEYIDPGTNNSPLTVSLSGNILTVSLETDSGGNIVSTAEDVRNEVLNNFNYALKFNTEDDFIEVGYDAQLNSSEFTAEFSSRVDGGQSTARIIIDSSEEGIQNKGYSIRISESNRWQFWAGVNPFSYYYNYGVENVAWSQGFGTGFDFVGKDADNLWVSVFSSTSYESWNTTQKVDLTNIDTLKVEWSAEKPAGSTNNPIAYLQVINNKSESWHTSVKQLSRSGVFSLTEDELDVSDLQGLYYIRIVNRPNATGDYSVVRTYKVWGEGSSSVWKVINGNNVEVGERTHLAVGHDGSNLVFMINGEIVGSEQVNYTPNNTEPLIMTAPGVLDEVRVWNSFRSQEQIKDNMNKEISSVPADLVGYWKLNNNALDSSGNNHHGTVNGTPDWVSGFSEIESDMGDLITVLDAIDNNGSGIVTAMTQEELTTEAQDQALIDKYNDIRNLELLNEKQIEIDDKTYEIASVEFDIEITEKGINLINPDKITGEIRFLIGGEVVSVTVSINDNIYNIAEKIQESIEKKYEQEIELNYFSPMIKVSRNSNVLSLVYYTEENIQDMTLTYMDYDNTGVSVSFSNKINIGIANDISVLRKELSLEENFTSEQITQRNQFIYEAEFNNDNIFDPHDLKEEALEVFKDMNSPKLLMNLDVANFLEIIPDHQFNRDKIMYDLNHSGLFDKIIVNYDTLGLDIKVEAMINEISYDFEEGGLFFTVSNVRNPLSQMEKTMKDVYSATSSANVVSSNKSKWDNVTQNSLDINALLSEVWNTAQRAIGAGSDSNIKINKDGITVIDPDDENKIIRINSNSIAISNDGGDNFKTAITGDGVSAKRLVGQIVIAANLTIANESGSFLVDKDGVSIKDMIMTLTRDDGLSRIILNPNDGIKIQKLENNAWVDTLYIDENGEGIFSGSVRVPRAGITDEGDEDSSVRIWAGSEYEDRDNAPLQARQDGSFVATRATIGTQGIIQYYVNPSTGNNDNPGTQAEPFQTIAKAISILPKQINHGVWIYVAENSDTGESIEISGFHGIGEIVIRDDANEFLGFAGDGYKVNSLYVNNCSCNIWINNMESESYSTGLGLSAFYFSNCNFVKAYNCKAVGYLENEIGSDIRNDGITFERTNGEVNSCTVHNAQQALKVVESIVYSSNWINDSGEDVIGSDKGLLVQGGTIHKLGNQPEAIHAIDNEHGEIIAPIVIGTTQNITYYVNGASGDDSNSGMQASPFKTIMKAINVLPKQINHNMNIIIKGDYNYGEIVSVFNFSGTGNITIIGDETSSTKPIIERLRNDFCNISNISYQNIDATGFDGVGFYTSHCFNISYNSCECTEENIYYPAFMVENSNVRIEYCLAANRTFGLNVFGGSNVYSASWVENTSELNNVGLRVLDGIIYKSGTQPLGITSEQMLNGGLITGGNWKPESNDSFDLGSSDFNWRDLYLSRDLYINGVKKNEGWDLGTNWNSGNVLMHSNDTTRQFNNSSNTKIKESIINIGGTLRIDYELRSLGSGYVISNIYRNGNYVGISRASLTDTWVNYTQNISGWKPGDLLQIYAYRLDHDPGEVRNLRVYAEIGLSQDPI